MSSVITGDKCWCTAFIWKQSKCHPSGTRHHLFESNEKTVLITFFDIDGLVHHEYVPREQMVNKEFYRTVLQCLRDAVRRHHPEKWRYSSWIPHHVKAPAHRAVITNEFLAKHNIPTLPLPPFSPDLAPCDFLFLQLKKTMRGRRFDYIEEIQTNATRRLRAITKRDYQRCFRQWQERWNKCIQAQGHYFEGDKTNWCTHSLTKKSVPELNDQPMYVLFLQLMVSLQCSENLTIVPYHHLVSTLIPNTFKVHFNVMLLYVCLDL